MSDKLDLGLKDFSQLVSGAAILISFFAGYKYGLRNASSAETKQTTSKSEPETAPADNLRVSNFFPCIHQQSLNFNRYLSNFATMENIKCY